MNTLKVIRNIKGLFKTNLFKHISVVFLWDNIAKFIGIITTIILIRILSKQDYALYTFFWAATIFFVGFISNGIDMAYVRFAAEEYSTKKKMPNDIFIFSLILCSLIFLSLSPVILIFNKQLALLMFKNTLYSNAFSLGFIAAIGLFFVAVVSRYYQVQEKYKKAGFILCLQRVLFLLILFIIVALGKLDFLKLAIVQTIVISIFGLSFISWVLKNNLLKEKLILKFQRFVIFLKASFWLMMYFICLALFAQLDIFMIARLMTENDLANYGVAFKYYGFLMLMFPSIKTVLKVRTSKVDMVESIERQKVFFIKWMKVIVVFAIPIISFTILFSNYFMNFLNGPKYTASILPFKILAISALVSYIFSPNTDIFRSMKKYFLLFCFGLMALIFNFFGNFLLIPILGISGAAIATLIAHLLINGSASLYIFLKSNN